MWPRIKFLADKYGITIARLEDECGLPNGTISRLKRGRCKCLSTKHLKTVAAYLGVTMDYLMLDE